MFLKIVLLLIGLLLIVAGANYLVDGASDVSRRLGVSEFVIGLTIVGMGSSAPEMVVSIIGAIQGKGDIAVGNVIGSNIFNTLLILGLTAILLPVELAKENRRRDIPMNILITALFVAMAMKNTLFGVGEDGLTRMDGVMLLLLFACYMWVCFHTDRQQTVETEVHPEKTRGTWLSVLMIVGGLAALVIGGNLFVDSATELAGMWGLSDKFIAVTILAGGTSLPELATCVAAAAKKKDQLALGNIIGSNLFNILLILGTSALIRPFTLSGVTGWDMGVLIASAVLLLACSLLQTGKKYELGRAGGLVFLLTWTAYMALIISKI